MKSLSPSPSQPQPSGLSQLVTMAEIAQAAGVCRRTAERWAASGELPEAVNLPGRIKRWRLRDIEAWLARRR